MNVLITGGAGFIGSRLGSLLIEADHTVTVVDDLSTGFRRNVPDKAIFLEADCKEEAFWHSLRGSNFDCIMHLAGQSSGEISFDNPLFDLDSNARAALLMLENALEMGCKRVVFASTMGIYGDQPDLATSEATSPAPKSYYSATKLFCEHYLRLHAMHKGLATTALRLFTVYGPGQDMDNFRQGMVSIYMGLALKHGHIHVKGSLERYRDFIYVDDVARAFIAAAQSDLSGYNFFNVCSGRRTTVEMLLSEIRGLFKSQISIQVEGSTPGDQFGLYGDNSKIIKELDWEPRVELASGLRSMKSWVDAHRHHFDL